MEHPVNNDNIELVTFLGPVIAVMISLWISSFLNKRNLRRNDKLAIFKVLMETRENPACMDYVRAVNSIDLIFHDTPKVRTAWKALFDAYSQSRIEDITNRRIKLL